LLHYVAYVTFRLALDKSTRRFEKLSNVVDRGVS
jgi:hypothetical protein